MDSRNKIARIKVVAFITAATMFVACNPTKKLKDGEHLLTSTRIINPQTNIDNSEIESYLKQKPNKKILGSVRFHLWLYNRANEEKTKENELL